MKGVVNMSSKQPTKKGVRRCWFCLVGTMTYADGYYTCQKCGTTLTELETTKPAGYPTEAAKDLARAIRRGRKDE